MDHPLFVTTLMGNVKYGHAVANDLLFYFLDRAGYKCDTAKMLKEGSSGIDRLDYQHYARNLAGLFRTHDHDLLPTAVGIYAPWGAGKVGQGWDF